jgi:hypothetical protein
VLREYAAVPAFQEYYRLDLSPAPNWLTQLLLIGLLGVLPALTAEKVLLSGYVLLLPLSMRYALKGVRAEAGALALCAFPFVYNVTLHLGFYNFVYSLILYFLTLGYWLRHRHHLGVRRTAVLAALLLVLYFTHPVSLAMAIIAIVLMAVVVPLAAPPADASCTAPVRVFRGPLLPTLLASLPVLVLILLMASGQAMVTATTQSFAQRVGELLALGSLVSFSHAELGPSVAFAALLDAAAIYLLVQRSRTREWQPLDALLAVAIAYSLLYLLAPDQIMGGSVLLDRLVLYPYFALLLWLAAQRSPRFLVRSLQVGATGVALLLLALHLPRYVRFDGYLEEYRSARELIEPGSTLLPLAFSSHGVGSDGRALSFRARPFLHAAGHLAAERRIVDFTNHQGRAHHFPVQFRPELNPYAHISVAGGIEAEPPGVDFEGYSERTGGRVDYVLVWQLRDEQRDLPRTLEILRQLRAGYELVHRSPGGSALLYRRRDDPRPQPVREPRRSSSAGARIAAGRRRSGMAHRWYRESGTRSFRRVRMPRRVSP